MADVTHGVLPAADLERWIERTLLASVIACMHVWREQRCTRSHLISKLHHSQGHEHRIILS